MKKQINREDDLTAEIIETPGSITVQEAGRRGGLRTSTRFQGTDFYRKIGTMGGRVTATRYRRLLSEFGRRGGRPRRPNLSESTGDRDR